MYFVLTFETLLFCSQLKNKRTDFYPQFQFWTESNIGVYLESPFPASVGRKGEIVRFLKPFPPPDQRDDKK